MTQKAFIAVAAVLLAVGVSQLITNTHDQASMTSLHNLSTELVFAFKQWKLTHKKSYLSPREELYRIWVFAKHLKTTQNHNKNNKKAKFKLGVNKHSDLTDEEYSARFLNPAPKQATSDGLGAGLERRVLTDEILQKSKKAKSGLQQHTGRLSYDYRDHQKVSRVRDQKGCAASWAFAAAGAMEQYFSYNKPKELSAQQLIDCSGKYGTKGCSGGDPYTALTYAADRGMDTASYYPYFAQQEPCYYKSSKAVYAPGLPYVVKKDEFHLKAAVDVTTIPVGLYSLPWRHYVMGLYDDYGACVADFKKIDYYGLIVGYGYEGPDEKNNYFKYWIVKTSLGINWGEAGYIRLARKDSGPGICGIALSATFIPSN